MHRLTGVDAAFLYIEHPTQNSTVPLLVTLGNGSAGGNPLTLPRLRDHVAGRLDVLPAFRWRVRRIPFGLHRPVMVNDPDFDLDFHLRAVTLEQPGGRTELDGLVASLAAKHLDRRHPLWQLTLVDGLEGGHQALILLFHHAWCDGTAIRTTLDRLLNDDPVNPPSAVDTSGDPPPAVEAVPWSPERPSNIRLLRDAVIDQVRTWRGLPSVVTDTARGAAAVKARRSTVTTAVPSSPGDTPPSVLNGTFSAERVFARTTLSVTDLRAVKDAADVSMNDVVLATVSASLRRYLSARGTLPARSLTVSVPVSTETIGAPPRQFGNRFCNFIGTLATDVDDPWVRLQTIAEVAREARHRLELQGPDLPGRWLDMLPSFVAERLARMITSMKKKHPERAEHSVLVSNVRGVDHYRLLGLAVGEVHVAGPPFDGAGLNVTVFTTGDRMDVAVLASSTALERPDELVSGLHDALAELAASVPANSTP